ncbi:pyrethroid hydrolase Ces2e-like [Branchiostoma lanceolatum]|uniref:pyrethroid hydrolase Ces2e-like n=1 Tax=Branchiostoma lanceolatum TaxID=7740 RepID=UPI003453A5FD
MSYKEVTEIRSKSCPQTGDVSAIVQPVTDQYLDPAGSGPDDPGVIRDQYLQFLTDMYFAAPTALMAQSQSAKPVRVFQYEFQHRSSAFSFKPAYVQADHSDEVFYVLGLLFLRDNNNNNNNNNTSWKYAFSDRERQLCLDIMAYWTNFAANGDPNNQVGSPRKRSLVSWPGYMPSSKDYLRLDMTSSADVALRGTRMKFWNEAVPRMMGEDVGSSGTTESANLMVFISLCAGVLISMCICKR